MPLSDLSPNLNRYACESPAPSSSLAGASSTSGGHGNNMPSSASRRATAGGSSVTKQAAPSSSLRRSPRLRHSFSEEAMVAHPRAVLADDNADGGDQKSASADADRGLMLTSTTNTTGATEADTIATLQLQLEQAKEEARSCRDVLEAVRDVVLSASWVSDDQDNKKPVEQTRDELRTLLGIEVAAAAPEVAVGSSSGPASTSIAASQVEAGSKLPPLPTTADDEGAAALDRSDLDILIGLDHEQEQQQDQQEEQQDQDQGVDMNMKEEQEHRHGPEAVVVKHSKKKQKLVLDDEDDNDTSSSDEDFAPKTSNSNKATKKKTSQRRRTFAVQGDSVLLAKDPSPTLADTSTSTDDSMEMDICPTHDDAKKNSSNNDDSQHQQSTPSPDRPFDETPSKCSSSASSAAALPSTGATGKSSSYSMTPDAETDGEQQEGEGDLSTSYVNDAATDGAVIAVSTTGASSSTKMVLDDDDGNSDDAPGAMDTSMDPDESYSERRVTSRASVKKSDKKKRRKTIALKEDSLIRASPSSAGVAGSPSPPTRKSAEEEWLPGSNATTSTPASSHSGDSFSLAAKAKDSMQKSSSSYSSAGKEKRVRRSERRRTLELQSDSNSLSALSASPAVSDGTPSISAKKNGDGDAAMSEAPVLPSPAPSDETRSLLSRGGALASVKETEAAPTAKAVSANNAAAPTPNDGNRPPLPPKRTSRRKSVLPERLRQDDILLDPNLTPNSRRPSNSSSKQQEAPDSAPGALPSSIGNDIVDELPMAKADAPASASSTASQPQKKRRRRSSIGIIAGGGLLTAKEIEGLSAYAESKKRSKNTSAGSRKRSHASAAETTEGGKDTDVSESIASAVDESLLPPTKDETMDQKPTEDGEMQQQQPPLTQQQEELLPQQQTSVTEKLVKVSVAGSPETMEAVTKGEGIPQVPLADKEEPMAIGSAPVVDSSAKVGCTTSSTSAPMSSKERRNSLVDKLEVVMGDAKDATTVPKQEKILLAAPSPVIQEEEDPLGIKSLIPAPRESGPDEQSSAASANIVRRSFPFDEDAINARAIKKRIPQLFPGTDALTQPCASARLFACASIVLETFKANTDGRVKRPASQLKYVLPTLVAFVQAELISSAGESVAKADTSRPKVLQFSSFDGSATMPPVDRKSGSHSHLENNIRSLENVFKEIDSLAKEACHAKKEETAEEIKECLDAIIFTLHLLETDTKSDMRNECAESMPFHWPAQRFVKAARTYRGEFEDARLLLEDKSSKDSTLRSRLGDYIGRAIRFYLRRFFDPVPLNLTNELHENYRHVDLSVVRSRVCEIVEMIDPDGGRDTAAADGSISSVFSYALRAIHAFFAINSERANDGEVFSTFFSSEASQRGLGPNRAATVILSDDDRDAVLADIHDVHIVLQGIKAAKFFRSLLHWPGVSAAIKDAGGWGKVETYSSMFQKLSLEKACPEEAYFTLLGDISRLLTRLDAEAEAMAEVERICEDGLRQIWKRFRCGTKSKAILQQNPHITTIAAYLRDGKSLAFPDLAEPSEEISEEE